MLIKDLLQTYEMEHSTSVFSSESNQKGPAKREVLALKNNVQAVEKEPLLLGIMSKFAKNTKLNKNVGQKGVEKVEKKEEVIPSKENESEGEME